MQGSKGGEPAQPPLPLTLLSRQAAESLAEQHSPLTFLEASYILPKKASGMLGYSCTSSNRYLEQGKQAAVRVFIAGAAQRGLGAAFHIIVQFLGVIPLREERLLPPLS